MPFRAVKIRDFWAEELTCLFYYGETFYAGFRLELEYLDNLCFTHKWNIMYSYQLPLRALLFMQLKSR